MRRGRSPALALLPSLIAALAACDESAPAAPVCADPAVEVVVEGVSWCAHHDVSRFTCPPPLPVRGAYEGVAFCGAARAGRDTAIEVVRAALLTGRVFARRTIDAFEMPAEWLTAPGAPANAPLDVPVVIVADDDAPRDIGDPLPCAGDFDHFEVEPVDGGRTLVVTAWDRLTCGPDRGGAGGELRETHPLRLPSLGPGRYTFASPPPPPYTFDIVPTAPLVVDLGVLCPESVPIEACFRGAAFAECGASPFLQPGLWCAGAAPPAALDCVWAECPPAGHLARTCGRDRACPDPHQSWGLEPWDRGRAMALSVVVDEDIEPGPTAVTCAAQSTDVPLDAVCGPADAPWRTRRSPTLDGDGWGWPSMVGLRADNRGEARLEGWDLSVELDVFADGGPRARACLINSSDGYTEGPPVCAVGGALTVHRLPDGPEAVDGLRAALVATFPEFPVGPDCDTACSIRGLTVEARF